MNSKKMALIFSPLLVAIIGAGVFLGVKFNKEKNNDESVNEIVDQFDYSYSKVFLSDSDGVLIPLTIKYEKFDNLGEELLHVTNMLKEDSKVSNDTFNGLLPSDCSVNNLELTEGVLSLDFDENFKNYESKNELKLLESLVWTLTDFTEVDSLVLSIDGEKLTNMPVNNTPIATLDKQIGINNYLLTSSMIFSGERVLSYYEKLIDDTYYYVPVTHYVKNKDELSIYDLTISSLFKNPGITSSMKVCRCLKDTQMVNSSVVNNNILYVSLTEDILFDETTVSLDVYNVIKETTALLEDVVDVSFLMELEEVLVNGKSEEEETQVSKIELNKYYI